jgi:hypothetical protein
MEATAGGAAAAEPVCALSRWTGGQILPVWLPASQRAASLQGDHERAAASAPAFLWCLLTQKFTTRRGSLAAPGLAPGAESLAVR